MNFAYTILIIFLIGIQEICSIKDEHKTQQLDEKSNPLANLILNENEIGDVNRNGEHTKDTLSRAKRQFYYDPYYSYRRVIPVPIVIGGIGFGGVGFGRPGPGFGRGFAGRGFGGRGFGGRGFGGRGFGFGGRGFGGFGGRGGRG